MPKLDNLPQQDPLNLRLVPVAEDPSPAVREPSVPYPLLAQMIVEARQRVPPVLQRKPSVTDTGSVADDDPIFRFD